jgi:hypothetical protein
MASTSDLEEGSISDLAEGSTDGVIIEDGREWGISSKKVSGLEDTLYSPSEVRKEKFESISEIRKKKIFG